MKKCTKCQIEQSLDQFYPRSDRPGKLRSHCKTCLSGHASQYYVENKDKIAEDVKRWREANRERFKAQQKRYGAEHKADFYRRMRKWEDNNRARSNAKRQRYYHNHPELERERRRQYGKQHPEKSQAYHGLRRARKLANGYERIEYLAIWQRDGGTCHICQQPVNREDVHFDHVIPLSRGGTHTSDNIRVSHSRCNLRKGAKIISYSDTRPPQ